MVVCYPSTTTSTYICIFSIGTTFLCTSPNSSSSHFRSLSKKCPFSFGSKYTLVAGEKFTQVTRQRTSSLMSALYNTSNNDDNVAVVGKKTL